MTPRSPQIGDRRSAPPPEQERDSPGDAEAVARTICLRLLTVRARSRAELSDALRRRGIPAEAAEPVLTRLTEVGLVDDAAFAEAFTRSLHDQRGLARRTVAARLRQRGLDDDAVDSAVERIDTGSELAAARALVERKLRSLGAVDSNTQTRRLLGLLARRGYSGGLAARVVRDALSASRRQALGDADDIDLNGA